MKKEYLLIIRNTKGDKVYRMESDNISELEGEAIEYLKNWKNSKYTATIYSCKRVCSYRFKNDIMLREV